jgi:putative addiction module component (TIGR02574 family)
MEFRMPSPSLKHALDIALNLSPTERAELAHDLLASLDGPADADAAKAWDAEIERRLDDVQSGKAQSIDAEEALNRIDARLRER